MERAQINEMTIKLHMVRHELSRQMTQGNIDEVEFEQETNPKIEQIDKARRQESELLNEINEAVSRFRGKVKQELYPDEKLEYEDYDDEY